MKLQTAEAEARKRAIALADGLLEKNYAFGQIEFDDAWRLVQELSHAVVKGEGWHAHEVRRKYRLLLFDAFMEELKKKKVKFIRV